MFIFHVLSRIQWNLNTDTYNNFIYLIQKYQLQIKDRIIYNSYCILISETPLNDMVG
jgi:hypothetical protein